MQVNITFRPYFWKRLPLISISQNYQQPFLEQLSISGRLLIYFCDFYLDQPYPSLTLCTEDCFLILSTEYSGSHCLLVCL